MKIFVATKKGQGVRPSDFCWTEDGEIVVMSWTCDRDANNPNPDGGCGCGRSLTGAVSHKATTTFTVEDRDIKPCDYLDYYISSFQDGGWLTGKSSDSEMRSALAAFPNTSRNCESHG